MSMAVVMSEMPDVWRKVLAEHVPDGQQHCRACFHDGGRASWPCQTYRIAQEAKWVAEGGLPGTGPHGPGPSRTRLSPPERSHEREPARYDDLGAPAASTYPSTGSWSSSSTGEHFGPSGDHWSVSTGLDDRPLAGDPLASPAAPASHSALTTGERPYGSTFDAPYGSSFGVDDRPHARW